MDMYVLRVVWKWKVGYLDVVTRAVDGLLSSSSVSTADSARALDTGGMAVDGMQTNDSSDDIASLVADRIPNLSTPRYLRL